ncbi:MAG TPA: GDP-mannose 4,6-dehydratase [Candidatus Saccharimonadia bacterium]
MATTQKRALITGITGQDGMYLAELLHAKNYQVYGLIRGQHNPKRQVVEREFPWVELIEGDLSDMSSLLGALEISQPDEVYNLGAISFVALSFKQPELTGNITGLGALRLLEAIRIFDAGHRKIRYYQASTSELYGKVRETPQNELTPFHPRSPYGVAKGFAHYTTVNYRESYGIHASCGILFNHESPRRGYEFVTRKVTSSVARIKLGLQAELVLGNIDSQRDWGFAGDYVDGMWRMLQQDEPDDYVLATGKTHPISELLELAFAEVGIDDWKPYVKQDKRYMRPAEVDLLLGDPSKAKRKLHWEPTVTFPELVKMMVRNDLEVEARRSRHEQAEISTKNEN